MEGIWTSCVHFVPPLLACVCVCVLFPRKIVLKKRVESFAIGYPFIAATAAMKMAHVYKGFTLFFCYVKLQEVSCETF